MKPSEFFDKALNYSNYMKGAEYSASDILSDPLKVKLRKKYPNIDDVKVQDKISAYIGTGVHSLVEEYIQSENAFSETNMQSEVRLKHKNLSGTADIIFDGSTIADIKTGKETNIKKQISNPDKWVKQLSIYSYLNHVSNKQPMEEVGFVFWLTVDTQKFGTLEVKLMNKKEVVQMIREFMKEMDIPIEDTKKCDSCSWLWRWCGSRSKCSYYADKSIVVEDW